MRMLDVIAGHEGVHTGVDGNLWLSAPQPAVIEKPQELLLGACRCTGVAETVQTIEVKLTHNPAILDGQTPGQATIQRARHSDLLGGTAA